MVKTNEVAKSTDFSNIISEGTGNKTDRSTGDFSQSNKTPLLSSRNGPARRRYLASNAQAKGFVPCPPKTKRHADNGSVEAGSLTKRQNGSSQEFENNFDNIVEKLKQKYTTNMNVSADVTRKKKLVSAAKFQLGASEHFMDSSSFNNSNQSSDLQGHHQLHPNHTKGGVPVLQLGKIVSSRVTARGPRNRDPNSTRRRQTNHVSNGGSGKSSGQENMVDLKAHSTRIHRIFNGGNGKSGSRMLQPSSTKASNTKFSFEDSQNKLSSTQRLDSDNVSIANGLSIVSSDRRLTTPRSTDGGGVENESPFPMTAAQALKRYLSKMTPYEQGEILDYSNIYFLGLESDKIKALPYAPNNHGYDDERGDYQIVLKDHIAYRFEVLGVLGRGSFGQVCKCFDHKRKELVALKLIRNKKKFHHQAAVEVRILEYLRDNDQEGAHNLIHIRDFYIFRRHLCITFELMSINLYEFIKSNNFHGVSLGLIRRFAVQLLKCLKFLFRHQIIHCDLKPENILLKQPNKSSIKVIDFGSSCFEDERVYTYIQSRFYRAPEIMLGVPYTTKIDMWSFGCILAELYTGIPIFPGENETEQMACIMEILDLPPAELLEVASRRKVFFDSDGEPKLVANSKGRTRTPGSKSLAHTIRCNDEKFLDFMNKCLVWDPDMRISPEEALQHPWIREGYVLKTRRGGTASGESTARHLSQTAVHRNGGGGDKSQRTPRSNRWAVPNGTVDKSGESVLPPISFEAH